MVTALSPNLATTSRGVLQNYWNGPYKVYDPSFDPRPVEELVHACGWMRERVQQIGLALRNTGNTLVAASQYLPLIETVDPDDI